MVEVFLDSVLFVLWFEFLLHLVDQVQQKYSLLMLSYYILQIFENFPLPDPHLDFHYFVVRFSFYSVEEIFYSLKGFFESYFILPSVFTTLFHPHDSGGHFHYRFHHFFIIFS
jgi:hypothetical protein